MIFNSLEQSRGGDEDVIVTLLGVPVADLDQNEFLCITYVEVWPT